LINRNRDGRLYYEEMTITPVGNQAGEITHFIAVKQDITERKEVEAALARSEKAYRNLFENMPIGLYRTSAEGFILDVNPAMVKMFGYKDQKSLLAKHITDFYVDPSDDDKFRYPLQFCGGIPPSGWNNILDGRLCPRRAE
jgi:PAS domain-containing protein